MTGKTKKMFGQKTKVIFKSFETLRFHKFQNNYK